MIDMTSNQSEGLADMQPLDALTFPLSASSLIEASAGTGKTYTIVNLYLRLLLGHGCEPLSVEQILVVTFTNAATAELRERIRQRLRKAYLDFYASLTSTTPSDDDFIQSLIEQSQDIEQDYQRLALASKQMDEAAVHTIHGFCQKALTEHAFESGALYDQRFILDESEWVQIAIEDYWRKHLIPLPKYVLQLVLDTWATPDDLLKSIYSFIYRDTQVSNSQSIEQCLQAVQRYKRAVEQVKAWWLNNKVSEQLAKANLKGNVKLAKLANLQKLDDFFQSDLLQMPKETGTWLDLVPEKVNKAKKKTGSADLSHLDFSQFELLNDSLVKCQNAIKVSFSLQAIDQVRTNLASHKNRLHMLSPDDLLSGLKRALVDVAMSENQAEQATNKITKTKENALANAIRQAYPAALIDEFQDTDPIQFEVFNAIYGDQKTTEKNTCLIMIGDPKQAIYAFRGADIFTYIQAKKRIDKSRHFTLATNWRSAPSLVQAINHVFTSSAKGFLFEQNIPFYPVAAGKKLTGLEIEGEPIASLHFEHYCHDNKPVISANDAQPLLAKSLANQVSHWLTLAKTGQARVNGNPLTAGDCCVLVRTRFEADIVKRALTAVNIDSVFLSRSSVFETQIAQDLFRFLKAISQPGEEKLLKTALMSELFAFNVEQLDELFNNELAWQNVLEQRFFWHQTWTKQGLMRALKLAFGYFNVEQVLISTYQDGLRRITDLQHLVELLQQQSLQLVGESQLIHWFESCLLEPDANSESQQMRLESDSNLVQIITLHASKGLEFPLVFIPFAPNFKASKTAMYHNQDDHLEVDFLNSDNAMVQAEYERLAEDIRLFYVAVTRAVYYCHIGLWNINLANNKKTSGFVQSALGCVLLAENHPSDAEVNGTISNLHISQRIDELRAHSDISYRTFSDVLPLDNPYVNPWLLHDSCLSNSQLNQKVQRTWRLTSYSALSKQQAHLDMPTPGLDEGHGPNLPQDPDVEMNQITRQELVKSAFTFQRGANAGSFLHAVLENVDFQQLSNLSEVIEKQSIKYGIDASWRECLTIWLTDVINCPINQHVLLQFKQPIIEEQAQQVGANIPLSLSVLSQQEIKVEMEFYMPLHQIQVKDFNQIINGFYPQYQRNYQFDTLNGMIKGFIDLMFEFSGRYYVADYKSNHLGDNYQTYGQAEMEKCMSEHDYHLQAILYTLALHRWLKSRLTGYSYDKHIGGAYYLFIRGMSSGKELANSQNTQQQVKAENVLGQGVYFIKPEQGLIESLDTLFKGSYIPPSRFEQSKNDSKEEGQLDLW